MSPVFLAWIRRQQASRGTDGNTASPGECRGCIECRSKDETRRCHQAGIRGTTGVGLCHSPSHGCLSLRCTIPSGHRRTRDGRPNHRKRGGDTLWAISGPGSSTCIPSAESQLQNGIEMWDRSVWTTSNVSVQGVPATGDPKTASGCAVTVAVQLLVTAV